MPSEGHFSKFRLVRAGRLGLPSLAALAPKASVFTNFTTPAKKLFIAQSLNQGKNYEPNPSTALHNHMFEHNIFPDSLDIELGNYFARGIH